MTGMAETRCGQNVTGQHTVYLHDPKPSTATPNNTHFSELDRKDDLNLSIYRRRSLDQRLKIRTRSASLLSSDYNATTNLVTSLHPTSDLAWKS